MVATAAVSSIVDLGSSGIDKKAMAERIPGLWMRLSRRKHAACSESGEGSAHGCERGPE